MHSVVHFNCSIFGAKTEEEPDSWYIQDEDTLIDKWSLC